MTARRGTRDTRSLARRLWSAGAAAGMMALAACAHAPGGRPSSDAGTTRKERPSAAELPAPLGARTASARALLRLAERLLADDAPAAALALYREAWAAGRHDGRTLTGIGRAQLAMGRPELALETLSRAVRAPGATAGAWHAYGEALLGMGCFAQAADAFDEALARGANPAALSAKAVALDALDRHEEALAFYRQARERAPEDPNLASNFALSLALHDRTEDALEILRRLAVEGRAGLVHRHNLALALTLAGDVDTARRVLRIDLDSDEAASTLAGFMEIAALPARERVAALVAASRPVSRAPSDVAVPRLADDENGRRAAARVMAPPPAPPPPPAHPVALPPLLDPTGWSVQIAAYRTPEQLIRGQRYYWRRFADILKDQAPRRSEVDYGPRKRKPRGFFYRLNVGELKGRDEARALCRRLKAAGAPCWVRPPEPSEGRLPEENPKADPAGRGGTPDAKDAEGAKTPE